MCNRDALVLVDQRSINDIQQRPNLAPGNHVFVVGSAGTGARRLAGGILHKLSNFFFQCHAVQERLDPGVQPRVRDAGFARAIPGFSRSRGRFLSRQR